MKFVLYIEVILYFIALIEPETSFYINMQQIWAEIITKATILMHALFLLVSEGPYGNYVKFFCIYLIFHFVSYEVAKTKRL